MFRKLLVLALVSMVFVSSANAERRRAPRPRPTPTPTPTPEPTPDPIPDPIPTPDPVPEPTPDPVPTPGDRGNVTNREDFEDNKTIWDENKSQTWNSGNASGAFHTGIVAEGKRSYQTKIGPGKAAVRMAIYQETQGVGLDHYSDALIYCTAAPAAWSWHITYQVKTVNQEGGSDPVISFNFVKVGTKLRGAIYSYVGSNGKYNTSGQGIKSTSNVDIPIGKWVHYRVYLKQRTDKTGEMIVWQDGQQICQVKNLITMYPYKLTGQRLKDFGHRMRQAAWGSYGEGISPAPWVMNHDDISWSTAP